MPEKEPQFFKKEEIFEKENLEKQIIRGKNFELIQEKSWAEFRNRLENVHYGDIVGSQIREIEQLEKQTESIIPEWVIENKNKEAEKRAKKLQKWYIENYPKEGGATFYGVAEEQLGKKVIVDGKKRADWDEGTLTRIYISSPSMNNPEIFKNITDRLIDNEVMPKVQIALNLESYQGKSLKNIFENNNIIIYVPKSNPEVLTKVIKSIAEAKQSNPDKWKLPSRSIAKAKRQAVAEFLIPLEDQVYFVEQEAETKGRSYHSSIQPYLFEEMHGCVQSLFDRDSQGRLDINEIHKNLSCWSIQKPAVFEKFPKRKKYMPGLVFDK